MKIEYHSWCLWCIHILWSHAAQQIPRCILRFPEWFMDRCIYPFPRLSWSVDSLGAWFQWWGLLAFTASRIRTISTSGRKRLRSTSGTSCAAQDAQPDGKAGPFFWGRRGDFPETMGIHGHPWASSHLTPNRPNHYPLIPLNIAYDSACDANICQLFINFLPHPPWWSGEVSAKYLWAHLVGRSGFHHAAAGCPDLSAVGRMLLASSTFGHFSFLSSTHPYTRRSCFCVSCVNEFSARSLDIRRQVWAKSLWLKMS